MRKKTQIISDSPSEFLKKKRLHDDNFKSWELQNQLIEITRCPGLHANQLPSNANKPHLKDLTNVVRSKRNHLPFWLRAFHL